MATAHREVYQPSFDEVPTYDLQDEEVEDAQARLPLLIVIALLVLAAFAGVVWLAYNQGVESGRLGVPAIIAAPEGPVRTAPGELVVDDPTTGLSVYQPPVAPEEEAAASALAPPPPPAPLRASQPPSPISTQPAPVVVTVPPAAAPPATVTAAPVPAPRPVPTSATVPSVVAVNTPPPAPVVPMVPAASAAPRPSPALASAGAVLQLGSYPSQELAIDGWQTLSQRHAAILGKLSSDVQAADIPNRGIWYRLRAGPFADRASAVAACEALRTQGGTCLVAQP